MCGWLAIIISLLRYSDWNGRYFLGIFLTFQWWIHKFWRTVSSIMSMPSLLLILWRKSKFWEDYDRRNWKQHKQNYKIIKYYERLYVTFETSLKGDWIRLNYWTLIHYYAPFSQTKCFNMPLSPDHFNRKVRQWH